MNEHYGIWVKRAAFCAVLMTTVLLLIKLAAWWHTGSVSLLASTVDSLLDIAASLTNLLVIGYALQPADSDHQFGHGKAESLSALAQSMFICGSAIFLMLTGFQRLFTPQPLQDPEIGIWVTLIALFSTSLLVSFQRLVVRKTESQAIRADMLHYQTDVWVNGAVLVALVLSKYQILWADAAFALLIGVYILHSACKIGYGAIQSLLDHTLPEDERQIIVEMVRSWPGIEGAHHLKTRRSGPTRFIQMHVELADDLPLVEAHSIAEKLESALLQRFPGSEVIIHQDPSSVVPLEKRGHSSL